MPSHDGQASERAHGHGHVLAALMLARSRPSTYAGLAPRGTALGPCRRGQGVRRRHQGRPVKVAPATPRLVDRGELLAALDRAAAGKVTIISAPAGSGKTSLLRAWANRPGQPHGLAVLQVQRDQQDAQLFWLALPTVPRRCLHWWPDGPRRAGQARTAGRRAGRVVPARGRAGTAAPVGWPTRAAGTSSRYRPEPR